MNTLRRTRIVMGGFAWAFLFLTPLLRAQTRIVCLGDSITHGDNTLNTYRRALWHRLRAAGMSVDFVGTANSNHGGPPPNPDFDLDHEGHRAWRADEIRNSLPSWLTAYTPDVALVHIGTNDAIQNHGGANFLPQTVEDIRGILQVLQNDNPNVTILLARLIPTSHPAANARVTDLNSRMDAIARNTSTSRSRIIVVDQNTGFSVANDTNDGTHPNSSGEIKMSNKWFEALNGLGLIPGGGAPPSAFANGSFESDFQGWTARGNQGIGRTGSAYTARDGQKLVVFNWGQTSPNGTLAQTFSTVSGQTYTLGFEAGILAYNGSEQRLRVTVQNDSSVLLSRVVSLSGNGNSTVQWHSQNFVFTANSSSATVTFADASSVTQNVDLLLDGVRIQPQASAETARLGSNLSFESNYANWSVTGNQGIGSSGPNYTATEGAKLVVFNWGQTAPNGVLSQALSTTPGQAYTLAFDAGVFAYNWNEQRLQVSVQGSGVLLSRTVSLFGGGNGSTRWVTQTFTFTANSGSSTLTFRDVSPTTDSLDLLLDNVRIAPATSPGLSAYPVPAVEDNGVPIIQLIAEPPGLVIRLTTPAGGFYRLERSEDLNEWHEVTTFYRPGAGVEDLDTVLPLGSAGFFRVIPEAPTAAGVAAASR